MTLIEWAEEEQQRLFEFVKWYSSHDCPETFPAKMEAGEWDEQYHAWSE